MNNSYLQPGYTFIKNLESLNNTDEMIGKRIFISYSRQDYKFASTLYKQLSIMGYIPWLDVMHIPIISNWWHVICDGIDNCDYYILVVSPWSMGSAVVHGELERAISKKKNILLVLLQTPPNKLNLAKLNVYPWIDIRKDPNLAFLDINAYINNPETANHSNLPVMGNRRFLGLTKYVPWKTHFTFLSILFFMYLGLHLGFQAILFPLENVPPDKVIIRIIPIIFSTTAILLIAFEASRINRFYTRRQNYFGALTILGIAIACLSIILLSYWQLWLTGIVYTIYTSDNSNIFSYVMATINKQSKYDIELAFIAIVSLIIFTTVNMKTFIRYITWEPSYYNKKIPHALPEENATSFLASSENAPDAFAALQDAEQLSDVSLRFIFHPNDAHFVYYLIATVEHQIQVNLSRKHQYEKKLEIIVLVVSEYSMSNDVIVTQIKELVKLGTPMIPLLIEDATPPQEIMFLNWFDTRYQLQSAAKNLMGIISRALIINFYRNPNITRIRRHKDSGQKKVSKNVKLGNLFQRVLKSTASEMNMMECLSMQFGISKYEHRIRNILRNIFTNEYPETNVISTDLINFIIYNVQIKLPTYFWMRKLGLKAHNEIEYQKLVSTSETAESWIEIISPQLYKNPEDYIQSKINQLGFFSRQLTRLIPQSNYYGGSFWSQKFMVSGTAPNTITSLITLSSLRILTIGLLLVTAVIIHGLFMVALGLNFALTEFSLLSLCLVGIPWIIKNFIIELWFRRRIRYKTLIRVYGGATLVFYFSWFQVILDQLVRSTGSTILIPIVIDLVLFFLLMRWRNLYENWLPIITDVRFKTVKFTIAIQIFILILILSVLINYLLI